MANESKYVKPVLSKKNENYISKHRLYELRHFCLQYSEWTDDANRRLVDEALNAIPEYLRAAMRKTITEDLGYTYAKMMLDIPCCKDVYYREYRRFFKTLSDLRS